MHKFLVKHPAVSRLLRMTFAVVIGLVLFTVGFLYFYQRKMIYFPRRYEPSYRMGFPKGMVEIEYATSCGKQFAYYHPPTSASVPKKLWMCFGGNASTALDWLDIIESLQVPESGFLLVEYPGYGSCEGTPSLVNIRDSSEAALAALAGNLKVTTSSLEADLNVLGLSIGTAAGLEFAVKHPVKKMVLLAPFTSMLEMARRSVGKPLNYLLIDRFDNAARLSELAGRPAPPEVHIFHGTADDLVPLSMSEELAAGKPFVKLHKVQGADHNNLLFMAGDQVTALLKD